MAGNTFKGWVPDTDPRYKGGSTISTGANLNPHFVKKSPTPSEPKARPIRPGKMSYPAPSPDTSKPAAEE